MMENEKNENLHAGHRRRMTERFRIAGFDGWQPHEVLEVLLYSVLPRINTNLHGHRLIRKFGSVKNVLEANPAEIQQVEGLGPVSAAYLTGIRAEVSEHILEQFRGSRDLDKYHFAFLADWFMREPDKPVGLLLCDTDEAFRDFLCLPFVRTNNGELDAAAMFERIGYDVTNWNFKLFIKDRQMLTDKDIFEIRRYTFGRSFILDEIYYLKGREPVPLLHPEKPPNSFQITW